MIIKWVYVAWLASGAPMFAGPFDTEQQCSTFFMSQAGTTIQADKCVKLEIPNPDIPTTRK